MRIWVEKGSHKSFSYPQSERKQLQIQHWVGRNDVHSTRGIFNDRRLGPITGKYNDIHTNSLELPESRFGSRWPGNDRGVLHGTTSLYPEDYTVELNLITDPLSLRVYGEKIWTLLHVHFRFDFNFGKNPLFATEFWASAYRATRR